MGSFLQSLIDPKKSWLAAKHMKSLSGRLRNYGLFFKNPNFFSLSPIPMLVFQLKGLIFLMLMGFGNLVKLGLRYDDLYDPYYDLDVKEALNRLPREIVDARHQRLLRAMDLSMKHQYLPEDLQVLSFSHFPLFHFDIL